MYKISFTSSKLHGNFEYQPFEVIGPYNMKKHFYMQEASTHLITEKGAKHIYKFYTRKGRNALYEQQARK